MSRASINHLPKTDTTENPNNPTRYQHLVFFPEYLIELNKEITQHPKLLAQVAQMKPNELLEKLGTVAAYAGLILDGWYDEADLERICNYIRKELMALRDSDSSVSRITVSE